MLPLMPPLIFFFGHRGRHACKGIGPRHRINQFATVLPRQPDNVAADSNTTFHTILKIPTRCFFVTVNSHVISSSPPLSQPPQQAHARAGRLHASRLITDITTDAWRPMIPLQPPLPIDYHNISTTGHDTSPSKYSSRPPIFRFTFRLSPPDYWLIDTCRGHQFSVSAISLPIAARRVMPVVTIFAPPADAVFQMPKNAAACH